MKTPRKCLGSLAGLCLVAAQLVAACAAAAEGLADSEEYVSEGRRYFFDQDFDKAAEYFAKAWQANPANCVALLNEGLAQLALREPTKAFERFGKCPAPGRAGSPLATALLKLEDLASRLFGRGPELDAAAITLKGIVFFYSNDSTTAKKHFEEALDLDRSYGDAIFWIGLVHLQRNETDQAIAQFRRALDAKSPPLVDLKALKQALDDIEARTAAGASGSGAPATSAVALLGTPYGDLDFWLGMTYYDQIAAAPEPLPGRFAQQSSPPTSRTAAATSGAGRRGLPGVWPAVEISNDYLAELEAPTWQWRLSAEAGSDSNPVLMQRDAVAAEPITSVVSPDSDAFFAVDLRGEYHPFYDRGGWGLGLVFEIDHVLHQDLDFLDSSRLRATAQLAWGSDPNSYLAGPLGYARVPFGNSRFALLLQGSAATRLLDGRSFEDSVALGAALTIRQSRVTATQLDFALEHLEVANDGRGELERSGDGWIAGVSQYLYVKRRDRYVRFGLEVGGRDAGAAFDASHTEARVELALPLAPRWALQLAAVRRDLDFDDLASNPLFPLFLADTPREDSATGADAALIFEATNRLHLVARGSWLERDLDLGSVANILDLDYDRSTASLGLTWFF